MLSKKTKYGLKTLIYLAKNQQNCPISAKEIAQKENIPYKFLENILRELKQNKVLKSERGAEGGYSFMQLPSQITVANLIRLLDGPIAMVSCASLNYYEKCDDCTDEGHCEIKCFFEQVRDATLPLLSKTIQELAIQ